MAVHLLPVRVDDTLVVRIERYRRGMQSQRRGTRISTAEAVRLLLSMGLDQGQGTDMATLPFLHWSGRKPKLGRAVRISTTTGLSALQALEEDRG